MRSLEWKAVAYIDAWPTMLIIVGIDDDGAWCSPWWCNDKRSTDRLIIDWRVIVVFILFFYCFFVGFIVSPLITFVVRFLFLILMMMPMVMVAVLMGKSWCVEEVCWCHNKWGHNCCTINIRHDLIFNCIECIESCCLWCECSTFKLWLDVILQVWFDAQALPH